MSAVLSQNATELAVSNPLPDWTTDQFHLSVKRAAERKVGKSGITTERLMLKRNDLISAVCADYRNHFAAIYGKSDRLPSDIHAKVVEAVEEFLIKTLTAVNPTNVISQRTYYYPDFKALEITQRINCVGENKVLLQHQLTACSAFIAQVNRRIHDLETGNQSLKNNDMLKEARARLVKLEMLHNFIKGEIGHQEKVIAETK